MEGGESAQERQTDTIRGRASFISRIFGPISRSYGRYSYRAGLAIFKYPYLFIIGGILITVALASGLLVAPDQQSDLVAWVPRNSDMLLDFGFASMFVDMIGDGRSIQILTEAKEGSREIYLDSEGKTSILTREAMLHLFDMLDLVRDHVVEVDYYECVSEDDCTEHKPEPRHETVALSDIPFVTTASGMEIMGDRTPEEIVVDPRTHTAIDSLLCVFGFDYRNLPDTDEEVLDAINDRIRNNRYEDYVCDPIRSLLGMEFDGTRLIRAQAAVQTVMFAPANDNDPYDRGTVWHDSLMERLGYYKGTWTAEGLWATRNIESTYTMEEVQEALYSDDPDDRLKNLVSRKPKKNSLAPAIDCAKASGEFVKYGTSITSSLAENRILMESFDNDLVGLMYGLIIAVIFSMVALSRFSRSAPLLTTRFLILLGGVFSAVLSIIGSYGLLGFTGLATSTVNIIAPCLCLALALDDIFVYVQMIGDAFNARRSHLNKLGVPVTVREKDYHHKVYDRQTGQVVSYKEANYVSELMEEEARTRDRRKRRRLAHAWLRGKIVDIPFTFPTVDDRLRGTARLIDPDRYIDLDPMKPSRTFADAYASANTAVLMTKSTSFMSFLVSAISQLPAITSFALQTFFVLFLLFFTMGYFFTALLRFDQLRIESGHMDIFPCIRFPKQAVVACIEHQMAPPVSVESHLLKGVGGEVEVELIPVINPEQSGSVSTDKGGDQQETECWASARDGSATAGPEEAVADVTTAPPLPVVTDEGLLPTEEGTPAQEGFDFIKFRDEHERKLGINHSWGVAARVNEVLSLDALFVQIGRFSVSRVGTIILLVLNVILIVLALTLSFTILPVGAPFDLLGVQRTSSHALDSARFRFDGSLESDLSFSVPKAETLKMIIPPPGQEIGEDYVREQLNNVTDTEKLQRILPPFSTMFEYRRALLNATQRLMELPIWPPMPDQELEPGQRGITYYERMNSNLYRLSSSFDPVKNWLKGAYEQADCNIDSVIGGTPCMNFDYNPLNYSLPSFASDLTTVQRTAVSAMLMNRSSDMNLILNKTAEYMVEPDNVKMWGELFVVPDFSAVVFGRIPLGLSRLIQASEMDLARAALQGTILREHEGYQAFVMDRRAATFFLAQANAAIVPAAIQGIFLSALAVFIVCLLLLANFASALIAVIGTFLVNGTVLFFMAVLGFNLECMSSTTLILGSGLSVDIIVHLAHAVDKYHDQEHSEESMDGLSARDLLMKHRITRYYQPGTPQYIVCHAVADMGPALFGGWLTTFIVVLCLNTARLTIIRIFYRQLVVILLAAAFHGYFTTPTVLCIMEYFKQRNASLPAKQKQRKHDDDEWNM